MKVKGTSVKSIPEFVHTHFGSKYWDWINALPAASREVMQDVVYTGEWYPIEESLIDPMLTVANCFYNGDQKLTAITMGRFSANIALRGVYMIYVKLGTPAHIIERGSRVMSAYFEPSELKVVKSSKNSLVVHITTFPKSAYIVEWNIAGWIQRALEISGCKDVNIDITSYLSKGDSKTEIIVDWK
jgi:hypothetical protein